MEINLKFSNHCKINSKYLVVVSSGKLKFDRSILLPVRELFVLDTHDPLIKISNSTKSANIKILQIPEHQSSHYRTGMVFNNDGSFNKGLSNKRASFLISKTITLKHSLHYKEKGLNWLLGNSTIPKYIIDHNRITNYDSSCYLVKEPGTNLKIIIPNALILRYFYYMDESLTLLMLNRKFDNIVSKPVQTDKYNFVSKKGTTVDNFMTQQYAKYIFLNGKNSETTDIHIAISSYYRDIFNAKGNIKAEPNDIQAKIPFHNEIEITLKGEMIADNKFLAYDIECLKPHKEDERLLSKPLYIIESDEYEQPNIKIEYQDNGSKLTIELDRESFAVKNDVRKSYSNHFIISQVCHVIKPNSIDYLLFNKHLKSPELYPYTQTLLKHKEILIVNSDIEHFKRIQEALNSSDLNFKYISLENSNEEPYSFIKLIQNDDKRILVLNKILIIKITYRRFEFFLIDAGAEFPIWFFINTGNSIKSKNNTRLTNLANYIGKNARFTWEVFNHLNDNSPNTQKRAESILETNNFKIFEPIFIDTALSYSESYNQLQHIIKLRLIKKSNELLYN